MDNAASSIKRFLQNFLLIFLLCSLAALAALARFDNRLIGIDDANIYFVYARNFANGHGFVFNVGGERVEGFTSLLWTLICALAFRFSSQPELVLLIINIVILSAGIAVALNYLQTDFQGSDKAPKKALLYSIVFVVLILSSPRYIAWNLVTLMENSVWSTLLLVTTVSVIRDHTSTRARNFELIPLLILLILARPESILWGSIFLGILVMRVTSVKNITTAAKELAPALICLVASLALLILFRLHYFGYPFPNTFYAKVSPSFFYNLMQGTIYLSKYMISDPVVLFSGIAIVISGIRILPAIFSKHSVHDGASFLPFIAAAGLLAPVLTGGDHFGSFRIYQNIYPIEVLCLLYFVDRVLPGLIKSSQPSRIFQWKEKIFKFGPAVILTLGFLSFQIQMWQSIKAELEIEFNVAEYGRKNGALIQALFSSLPKLPSLGVVSTGGTKYAYEGEVIDLMGLNNTTMAHNHGDRKGIKNHAAFDIPTFYKLQPYIVWPVTVIETDWHYSETALQESWENKAGFKGLFDQPDFLELYSYAKVSERRAHQYALVGWFRNDFLEQLFPNTNFLIEKYEYTP